MRVVILLVLLVGCGDDDIIKTPVTKELDCKYVYEYEDNKNKWICEGVDIWCNSDNNNKLTCTFLIEKERE